MTTVWSTTPDDRLTREDLAGRYGGSVYSGGVVPSRSTPNVLLFTDPVEGARYGYAYDGASPDGAAYFYTGRGSTGDQTLDDNAAIMRHREEGRVLRLFVSAGTVPGRTQKYQRYLGAFALDQNAPARREPAPDVNGNTRTVLVFRLLPDDDVARESVQSERLAPVQPDAGSHAETVPLEVNSESFYETSGTGPGVARKREDALVKRFAQWSGSSSFRRWAIRLPDGTLLLTDAYDPQTKTLYEAKSSVDRNAVRIAIGQLLDYRRHIAVEGMVCSLLLPAEPSRDLRDLVRSVGFGLAYAAGDSFEVGAS